MDRIRISQICSHFLYKNREKHNGGSRNMISEISSCNAGIMQKYENKYQITYLEEYHLLRCNIICMIII
jgi:hypothetical protein